MAQNNAPETHKSQTTQEGHNAHDGPDAPEVHKCNTLLGKPDA